MLIWIGLFLVSIVVLWQSSNRVLTGVRRIARAFGISEIAVTLLVLSILASLPEFLISAIAALNHTSDVSLGTIVGSNIFTLLVVLGLAALIRPFHVKMVIEERDSVWMLLSSAVILIFISGGISRLEGACMLLLYLPYIFSVYQREKRKKSGHTAAAQQKANKWKEALILVVVTFLMLASAQVVLWSGLKLAARIHIPALLMGLIFMGIGTSIPETAIGISSALKKKTDITLGDVYGTNIFTCLCILGVCALIQPIPVSADVQIFILPFFIFSTIILQLFFSARHRIGRLEGILLIILYLYFALASLDILPIP